jgi:hypothetical protein
MISKPELVFMYKAAILLSFLERTSIDSSRTAISLTSKILWGTLSFEFDWKTLRRPGMSEVLTTSNSIVFGFAI